MKHESSMKRTPRRESGVINKQRVRHPLRPKPKNAISSKRTFLNSKLFPAISPFPRDYAHNMRRLAFLYFVSALDAIIPQGRENTESVVSVPKCCPTDEIFAHDNRCVHPNDTLPRHDAWRPNFVRADENGDGDEYAVEREIVQQPYTLSPGVPQCKGRELWPVYDFHDSCDKLQLMTNGKMRHYVSHGVGRSSKCKDEVIDGKEYYDYAFGEYCLDKVVIGKGQETREAVLAIVCIPKIEKNWIDADFAMRRIIGPIIHGVSISCYLIVAIVYFVLPQLCDLVGNIVTTIGICLIVGQVADIARIFTEFNGEISYFLADSLVYMSVMSTFFWLCGMGYYIWNTFKSRNVFMRITDGKKYCYYSIYIWFSILFITSMAIFAHVVFDAATLKDARSSVESASIGGLGVTIFYLPIAATIATNTYFCMSTVQTVNRMSTYGRIHHKLKYHFKLFIKIFVVLTFNWVFFVLSHMPFDAFFYLYQFSNLLQAVLFLYVAVMDLKRVRFLLRKACCYDSCFCASCRPGDVASGDGAPEWGEEMMAMNTSY